MKVLALFLFITCISAFAQDKLINTYSFYSEVYGGMEDSGIARTDSYIFIAQCDLSITEIYFENNEIFLHRGDTLQISMHYFTPYISQHFTLDTATLIQAPHALIYPDEKFVVHRKGRTYYVNIQYPHSWNKEINYVVKKRTFIAKAKADFDTGYTGYAP
jgi:hypothetical protein